MAANQVTVEDFVTNIRDKKTMYEAMQRHGHGYFLPDMSSSMCTEEYLQDVAIGKLWCPRYDDIRLRPCPRPPSKKMLIPILVELLAKYKKQLDITAKHQPDKA